MKFLIKVSCEESEPLRSFLQSQFPMAYVCICGFDTLATEVLERADSVDRPFDFIIIDISFRRIDAFLNSGEREGLIEYYNANRSRLEGKVIFLYGEEQNKKGIIEMFGEEKLKGISFFTTKSEKGDLPRINREEIKNWLKEKI